MTYKSKATSYSACFVDSPLKPSLKNINIFKDRFALLFWFYLASLRMASIALYWASSFGDKLDPQSPVEWSISIFFSLRSYCQLSASCPSFRSPENYLRPQSCPLINLAFQPLLGVYQNIIFIIPNNPCFKNISYLKDRAWGQSVSVGIL